jgi:transcriptional regulator with XRE-family HTH domain
MGRRRKIRAPVDDKIIGERLREIRRRRGFTQGDLAEKLDLNQPLISQYERGGIRLHGALVAAFAKVLRVSADELLGLKDGRENGLATDRRLLRRLQKMEDLSRRDKQALIRTIDGFLSGRARPKR